MEFREPRRVKGNIERIVIPKHLDVPMSLSSHAISESMGFSYGIKKDSTAYLGMISLKGDFWKKQINPTYVDFDSDRTEDYIQMHNQICKKGSRMFRDFLQVAYHSHPKLIEEDLTDEQREFLVNMYPEFEGNISEIVGYLDNTWLSEADQNFARKYSSKGLALLSVGKQGDPRQNRGRFLKNIMTESASYLFNKKNSRMRGFRVQRDNCCEIPVVIAENSDNPLDKEISEKVAQSMKPLSDIYLDYSLRMLNEFGKDNPKMARAFQKIVNKSPLKLSVGKLSNSVWEE